MGDAPGGAAAMKATAPFAFRYQYLAGGVNTGNGWATWNPNGDFARFYIQDSVAQRHHPGLHLLHAVPVAARRRLREPTPCFTNLNNTATMTAYYNDLKLFFQKAGAFPEQRVVAARRAGPLGLHAAARHGSDDAASASAPRSRQTGLAGAGGPAEQRVGLRPGDRQAARHLRAERRARLSHQRLGHRHRHRARRTRPTRPSTRSPPARRPSTSR